jgi:hypothetical protein
MNNEMKRIWKEASLPYSIYCPGIGVASLKIKTKKPLRGFPFPGQYSKQEFSE